MGGWGLSVWPSWLEFSSISLLNLSVYIIHLSLYSVYWATQEKCGKLNVDIILFDIVYTWLDIIHIGTWQTAIVKLGLYTDIRCYFPLGPFCAHKSLNTSRTVKSRTPLGTGNCKACMAICCPLIASGHPYAHGVCMYKQANTFIYKIKIKQMRR